ncbi:MAG: hypothetical protein R3B47_13170 [Bacteroidia bacterium]
MNNYLEQLSDAVALSGPLLLILASGLVAMLVDAFKARKALPWVAAAGLVLSMAWSWTQQDMASETIF